MGGYDLAALDIAIELLGVRDVEALLYDLTIIRDHQ